MDLKRLGQQAKSLFDKRGGSESAKEDASELKDIATGSGSMTDKAKAAAAAIKEPGANEPAAAAATEPEQDRPAEKVADKERGNNAGAKGRGRHGGQGRGRGGGGGGGGGGRPAG